jgi:hypothetical protein
VKVGTKRKGETNIDDIDADELERAEGRTYCTCLLSRQAHMQG